MGLYTWHYIYKMKNQFYNFIELRPNMMYTGSIKYIYAFISYNDNDNILFDHKIIMYKLK